MDKLTPEQRQRNDANLQQATLRRLKRLEQWHISAKTSLQRSVSQANGTLRVKVQYTSPPKEDRYVSVKENLHLNHQAQPTCAGAKTTSTACSTEDLFSPIPCAKIIFDSSPSAPAQFALQVQSETMCGSAETKTPASMKDEIAKVQNKPDRPLLEDITETGVNNNREEEESKLEHGAVSDHSIVSEDPALLDALDELERSFTAGSCASTTKQRTTTENKNSSSLLEDVVQDPDDLELIAALEELEKSGILDTSHNASTASTASTKVAEASSPSLQTFKTSTYTPCADKAAEAVVQAKKLPEESAPVLGADDGGGDLNSAQRLAAFHDTEQPLLVLAGAGSGKTKTLIQRVLHLVKSGAWPEQLLALTFSTAAAAELQRRVKKALPKRSGGVTVQTFHAFALSVCREFGSLVGLPPDFVVFTAGRTRKVVTQGLMEARSRQAGGEANKVTVDSAAVKKLCQTVTQAKAHGQAPDALEGEARSVLAYYEEVLRQCGSLDFGSLISKACEILRDHAGAREQVQGRHTHLLVDEFQDTSRAQLELIRAVAQGGRITVVGDDDQTIFGFNGSNHRNFSLFRTLFPAAREVRLEHNFRSTSVLVHASRAVIQHNQHRAGKTALPTSEGGELISVVECRNEQTEAAFVVADIKARATAGAALREMAILCRTNRTGREFQAELRKHAVAFNVHGVSFWRRKVIKAVVAALRLVRNPVDDQAARRMLKTFLAQDKEAADQLLPYLERQAGARGVSLWAAARESLLAKVCGGLSKRHVALGRRMVAVTDSLITLARNSPRLVDFVGSVMAALPQSHLYDAPQFDEGAGGFLNEGGDKRTLREVLTDHIRSFDEEHRASARTRGDPPATQPAGGRELSECEREIGRFLDRQVVEEERSNRQIRDDNRNAVTLSTIHHSKGLEWATVYLVRFNAGQLPLTCNVGVELSGVALEEERRLCYVAMTRARERLTISHVKTLQKQASPHAVLEILVLIIAPSPFLGEIPSNLLIKTSCYACLAAMACPLPAEGEEENDEEPALATDPFFSCGFLQRFDVASRGMVASLFRRWAKMPLFKDPHKLLLKVKGVIHERQTSRSCQNRAVLAQLLAMVGAPEEGSDDNRGATALSYAREVLAFEEAPMHLRELHRAAKARHFAQHNGTRGMETKPPSAKQIGFLKSLGCPAEPKTMLEASALIERYKKM